MAIFVALLRGINVGGHRKLPMADLRALAEELGFSNVRTYVASGNLLFMSDRDPAGVEAMLERAIEKRFGFAVDVIARTGSQWNAYCDANPMPAESALHPNLVMMAIGKQEPREADVAALRARAAANERVELSAGALWLYFGNGAGRSKMGTGSAKGIWTTRNWRTVLKIQEMM